MKRFTLRRLRSADALAFRAIRLQALRDHPEAFGAASEEEQLQSEARFSERLETGHVIGGFDDQADLVGTIGISRAKAQKTQHIASIWAMYVSPPARGLGLARQLLDAAIAELGSSVRSIRLFVEAENAPAISLYESAGFKAWARDVEALKVGDRFHDEILMRLDVN